jgi:hypothetical protein
MSVAFSKKGRHASNIVDGITFGGRYGLIIWIRHLLNSKLLSFKCGALGSDTN